MKYIISIFVLILFLPEANAQTCPSGTRTVYFPQGTLVQVSACIENEVNLGKQSVFWGAKNLTSDKLHVKFTKVVYTRCGNIMKSLADTYLDPGAFISGTTFSGEMTFETQVWKEDCVLTKDRIEKVTFEDLVVTNLSQQEREKVAQNRNDEHAKMQNRLAAQKAETDSQNQAARQQAQQRQYTTEQQRISDNNTRLQQTQDYINNSNASLKQQTDAVRELGDQLINMDRSISQSKADRELDRELEREQRRINAQREEEERKQFKGQADREAKIKLDEWDKKKRKALFDEELIRRKMFGQYFDVQKYIEFGNDSSTLFYVSYSFSNSLNQIRILLYKIDKSVDQTWPSETMINDVFGIESIEQVIVSTGINEEVTSVFQVLGYFTYQEAINVSKKIETSAKNYIPNVEVRYDLDVYVDFNDITKRKRQQEKKEADVNDRIIFTNQKRL